MKLEYPKVVSTLLCFCRMPTSTSTLGKSHGLTAVPWGCGIPERECLACAQVFTFADTAVLSAGLYNALHVTYSGGTANGVTYTAADSRAQGLADFAFQILPVSRARTAHSILRISVSRVAREQHACWGLHWRQWLQVATGPALRHALCVLPLSLHVQWPTLDQAAAKFWMDWSPEGVHGNVKARKLLRW